MEIDGVYGSRSEAEPGEANGDEIVSAWADQPMAEGSEEFSRQFTIIGKRIDIETISITLP